MFSVCPSIFPNMNSKLIFLSRIQCGNWPPFRIVDVIHFCVEGYCELFAIEISFDIEGVFYFLLDVFRPPHNCYEKIDHFIEWVHKCLKEFTKPNRRIIVSSDFNIDLPTCDRSSRKLLELMLSSGIHQTAVSCIPESFWLKISYWKFVRH